MPRTASAKPNTKPKASQHGRARLKASAACVRRVKKANTFGRFNRRRPLNSTGAQLAARAPPTHQSIKTVITMPIVRPVPLANVVIQSNPKNVVPIVLVKGLRLSTPAIRQKYAGVALAGSRRPSLDFRAAEAIGATTMKEKGRAGSQLAQLRDLTRRRAKPPRTRWRPAIIRSSS